MKKIFVYLTHKAISEGILGPVEVELIDERTVKVTGLWQTQFAFFSKPDWHEDLNEAKDRAEWIVERKIDSLERQLERLKKKKF